MWTAFSNKRVGMPVLLPWQSFSNADLVDEEPFLGERSCVAPQWRCYAKFISCQQILLTFLPASFTGTPQCLFKTTF